MKLFRLPLRAFPGVVRSGFQLLPRTNSAALATTRLALPRSPPALEAALRALEAAQLQAAGRSPPAPRWCRDLASRRNLIGGSSIGISSVSHRWQLHRYLIGGNCVGISYVTVLVCIRLWSLISFLSGTSFYRTLVPKTCC